jgi:hypothetical protein
MPLKSTMTMRVLEDLVGIVCQKAAEYVSGSLLIEDKCVYMSISLYPFTQ